MKILLLVFITFQCLSASAKVDITGVITADGKPVPFAKVRIRAIGSNALTDENGKFLFTDIPNGVHLVEVFAIGLEDYSDSLSTENKNWTLDIKAIAEIQEMVVTGTMKPVRKKESTVNVEVFSDKFFQQNPTPNIYDAMQNVNGVRPQLNCAVCSTGDIHINGLEGPYTMVLIDGMPIVSSLSTVYGLMGIPTSLVDRVEVIKGPASALYGSEAVGGLINIITKNADFAPVLSADVFTTSWLETSADLGLKFTIGNKVNVLTGVNYYNYDWKQDRNKDNFTDVTLQNRISVFQKWNFKRDQNRIFSIAGRYFYEDRRGGEMEWDAEQHRGGEEVYGESIYTSRLELITKYQLPFKERVIFSASFNSHNQNSFYGNVSYQGKQVIGFGQLHWDKRIGKHDLLAGLALRYTFYDDDTPATETTHSTNPQNNPSSVYLPGVFIQDEIKLNKNNKVLLSTRYDYNSDHGNILTPRLGYKMSLPNNFDIRLNTGTGYRIVNIFTEDHAALTGSRTVDITEEIRPETSYNANINLNKIFLTKRNGTINLDLTGFYTYFNNRIIADYDSDPNKIIYDNLEGHGVNQGVSLNATINIIRNLRVSLGATYMDMLITENGVTTQQILSENFSGTWSISAQLYKKKLVIDYTANIYGPMRLPLAGDNDPRPEYSPTWSIQNIQFTYKHSKGLEFYGGIKNLLDWTPTKNLDFLIARAHDPFDENVVFDSNGNALPTTENPYGLTFDAGYAYAPNQGIRGFIGLRYYLK